MGMKSCHTWKLVTWACNAVPPLGLGVLVATVPGVSFHGTPVPGAEDGVVAGVCSATLGELRSQAASTRTNRHPSSTLVDKFLASDHRIQYTTLFAPCESIGRCYEYLVRMF